MGGMVGADFQIDDGAVLKLTGDWTATALGRTPARLERAIGSRAAIARIDTSDMGRFDTAGALALMQATGGTLTQDAFDDRPEAGRVYALVEALECESAEPPRRASAVTRTFE